MSNTDNRQPVPAMILGEVASSGLARGRALLCDCAKQTVVPRRQVSEAEALKEIERFDASLAWFAARQFVWRSHTAGRALGQGRKRPLRPRSSLVPAACYRCCCMRLIGSCHQKRSPPPIGRGRYLMLCDRLPRFCLMPEVTKL